MTSDLMEALHIDVLNDNFTIYVSHGIAAAYIRLKPTGQLIGRFVRYACGEWIGFRPDQLSIFERRRIVAVMWKDGVPQCDIVRLLNVSQGTISLDMRVIVRKDAVKRLDDTGELFV